jgi:hypothetical protein
MPASGDCLILYMFAAKYDWTFVYNKTSVNIAVDNLGADED